ncbi:MAG: carboxypeptidase regulatory-like domain-containing protein [Saprospiraceae bacterium]|nr:carboxypeptidase regulatory-like domain-containing protein [Saprospiraceae bacterium]
MPRLFLFIVVVYCFGLLSCHRDDIDLNINKVDSTSPVIYQEVTGTVFGYVLDNEGRPVPNAKVEIYSSTTSTNDAGMFVFKNVKMDAQGTYISVVRDGFLEGSDYIYPRSESINYSYVRLVKPKPAFSLTADAGGVVETPDGLSVTFPGNAFVTQYGQDYSGKVNINLIVKDASSPDFASYMPGGLMGNDLKGSRVIIGVAGYFRVDAFDANGNTLNLKQNASVVFSFTSNKRFNNLSSWWFDQVNGMWIERNMTSFDGYKYHGVINQLGAWLIGDPYGLKDISSRIVDSKGLPVNQAKINIECTANGQLLKVYSGLTDANGFFNAKLPENRELKMSIQPALCDSPTKELQIGPFNSNVVLNNIELNLNERNLSFTTLCNGKVFENAVVLMQQGNKHAIIQLAAGNSEFNIFNYSCAFQGVSIYGVNLEEGTQSEKVDLSEFKSSYQLEVCKGGCNLNATFNAHCNTLAVQVTGGSGVYGYQWDEGSHGDSISISSTESKVYSVTVTDIQNPGCSKVFSYLTSGAIDARIVADDCKWPVSLRISGDNISQVTWFNGNSGNEIIVTPSGETTYKATVTNTSGCSKELSVSVNSKNFPHIDNVTYCYQNLYSLSGDFVNGKLTGDFGFSKILNDKGDLEELNVLETGYKLSGVLYGGQGCQENFNLQIPNYNGLKILNFVNDEIIDGNKIIYSIGTGSCYNCDVGDVSIFSIYDLNEDYSQQNLTGLSPGYYYVVVKDAKSGCFIAHKKVKIL